VGLAQTDVEFALVAPAGILAGGLVERRAQHHILDG